MAQVSIQAAEAAPAQAASKPLRLFFIDHLRAALVILVVLHHVALVYGASSPFYYVEPPFNDSLAFNTLLVFVLMNQAWFMGAFFLLAGYFTPGSIDRKGTGAFLKDRLIRLGIPLIVFTFVLSPIANLGFYLMPATLTGITSPPSWEVYPEMIGIGPLWFVAMLLLFSIGYAAWRWMTRQQPLPTLSGSAPPGYLLVGLFILALAVVSFFWRMVVPLGQSVEVFTDAISFPTIAYLPQYLSFFVLGIVASRRDWFRTLPGSMGAVGVGVAVAASVVLFPLAFSGQLFSLEVTDALDNAMGNGHWQSAAYVAWDSLLAVGLCLGLIPLFRRFFNARSRFGTLLAQQSYAVYVLHIPIIVFLAYALSGFDLANLLKFAVASVVIVPACYAIAYVVRRIPLVSRVL